MPSVGHFLALFEAVSRRDWKTVREIGSAVAEEEKEKKHFNAAHRILQAVQIAASDSGFDLVGQIASPSQNAMAIVPPPELLHSEGIEGVRAPFLNSQLEQSVQELFFEWKSEQRLRNVGLSPRQTVLLYGPPGCGKSHLARFIAKSLDMRIFTVRFDSLISSFLGETGGNIRKVFEFASLNRCVLFIDEIDAIAKLRDDKNELGELKRVVISLLQNLDLSNSRSLLVAATNHPHMLDPALWRRFQVVWEIPPPSPSVRKLIFENYLAEEFPSRLVDLFQKVTDGLTGADIESISLAARRKRLLGDNTELPEALLLAALEYFRRQAGMSSTKDFHAERRLALAIELKCRFDSKYSFNEVENISGVPHSTLHSKVAASTEKVV